MTIRFTWNETKAATNLRKHKISFDLAARVFDDPCVVTVQDRVEGGEYRWQATGYAGDVLLLVVAYTTWDENDEEVINIISARRAEPKERKRYEKENLR